MWNYFLLGFSFAFAAAAQPGPTQAFLLSETLAKGWRRALPASFAPLLSDAPIVLAALLLISRLPPAMLRILHLAGACFLFYLAWDALRAWRGDLEHVSDSTRAPRTLSRAALVNFLNPNPWLGWTLVMGPLFLKGFREAPAHGIALLVAFYGTLVAGFAGLILLFAAAGSLGPQVRRTIQGISLLALLGFGVYQLYLGLRPA